MSKPSDVRADPDLTEEEQLLVRLLLEGLTDEAAAARLHVSPRAFSRRLKSVMTKLGVSSRLQLGYAVGHHNGQVAGSRAGTSKVPIFDTAHREGRGPKERSGS